MLNTLSQKMLVNKSIGIETNNRTARPSASTKPYMNDTFTKTSNNTKLTFKGKGLDSEQLLKIHRHFNELIAKDPRNSTPFFERAKIYAENGLLKPALEDIGKAISLDPKNFFLRTHRGAMNLQLEEHKDAVEDFTAAINLGCKLPMCFVFRGDAYKALGRHDLAIKDYNTALSASGNDNKSLATTYNNRGESHEALKNTQQAFEDYSRAIGNDASLAKAYFNRSSLVINSVSEGNAGMASKMPQAIQDSMRATQLEPSNKLYKRQLRQVAVGMMNSNEERVGFYEQLLQKDNRDPELYAEKATIHEMNGETRKAEECRRMATLLGLTKDFFG